jgi:serine phosphatase RsbU (regulator of sigma subunit)
MPIYKDLEKKIFNGSKVSAEIIKKHKIKNSNEFFAFAVIAKRIYSINCKLGDDSIIYYAKIAYSSIVAFKDFELKKSSDIISIYKDKAMLQKKQLETELEIKQQRFVIIIFSILTLLIILFLFFYYKANQKLGIKNRLIKKQQDNIIDSINYASRIQQSILLPEIEIRKTLKGFFAYYKPRDIVSGDFYWHSVINDTDIIAAVDCTGHGVPGAFMSMIGNTLLNEIVIEKRIIEPGLILSQLHESVINTLHQNRGGQHAQDGMDISICSINAKKKEIKFAGAKNPIYFTKNSQIESIKGDAYSIGGMNPFSRKLKGTEKKIDFTTKQINYIDGMSIYLFTDGYMDQFGLNDKIQFNAKRFKKMLLDIHNEDPETQKKMISEKMEIWKGENRQLDDMLVIGFKV